MPSHGSQVYGRMLLLTYSNRSNIIIGVICRGAIRDKSSRQSKCAMMYIMFAPTYWLIDIYRTSTHIQYSASWLPIGHSISTSDMFDLKIKVHLGIYVYYNRLNISWMYLKTEAYAISSLFILHAIYFNVLAHLDSSIWTFVCIWFILYPFLNEMILYLYIEPWIFLPA